MHGHTIHTDTNLSIRAHPLPVWIQSILLTHSLASRVTNSLLASWVHCPHLSGFWVTAVLCSPVAVLCGVTWRVSLAGHHNPWGRVFNTEGRGQGLNESTFMLLCYDMNSERVILALNVYIMSGELLH